MSAVFRKVLKILAGSLVLVLLYIAGVLIYGTLNDFQPTGIEKLTLKQRADTEIVTDSTLDFLIWNVGYSGLGAEPDFFFDNGGLFLSNGNMVITPENLVEKNYSGILDFLKNNPADFFLLQEVDVESKRSYFKNMLAGLSGAFPKNAAAFAVNYRADWVAIPVLEPWKAYGKTESGLVSLSKYEPVSSFRHQLPGNFSWPDKIFQLDRCALLHRFRTDFGKDLVVINIHNSAHDKTGEIKKQQLAYLKKLFLEEFEKGNFVVVGGDWNECPPAFDFDTFMSGNAQGFFQSNIPADFLPEGWKWVYDKNIPTNRKCRSVYKKGETFVTLIDFFVVSPNVEVIDVAASDLDFQFSDHQPVRMKVRLKI